MLLLLCTLLYSGWFSCLFNKSETQRPRTSPGKVTRRHSRVFVAINFIAISFGHLLQDNYR